MDLQPDDAHVSSSHETGPGVRTLRWIVLLLPGALLVIILIVSVGGARRRGTPPRLECLGRLRQVGLMMQMYADSFGGFYPTDPARPRDPLGRLERLVRSNFIDETRILVCPGDQFADGFFDSDDLAARLRRSQCSYSVNVRAGLTADADGATALVADEPGGPGENSINHGVDNLGQGVGQNVFFVDGAARWLNTPATEADPNIFEENPETSADAYIPDTGP